jgi:hypothetical protein
VLTIDEKTAGIRLVAAAGRLPMNVHALPIDESVSPIDPARLAEANINPATGLASDYLNHFNEAIMMLDLLSSMPDCIDDLIEWQPMSYREHFLTSSQKHRELVLAAYSSAEPEARRQLDDIVDAMNATMIATRSALELNISPEVLTALAREAAANLKPLVARAGAVINGLTLSNTAAPTSAPQAAVDALLER